MAQKFKKKSKVNQEIPTASMPDIIFMLLIFFMVTTVLKKFNGLPVRLPEAEKIVKIESLSVNEQGVIDWEPGLDRTLHLTETRIPGVVDDRPGYWTPEVQVGR